MRNYLRQYGIDLVSMEIAHIAQPANRRVRTTLHRVSAAHAIDAEVRPYDSLFTVPDSLTILTGCKVEPSLSDAHRDERFRFERVGYFTNDRPPPPPDMRIFNRAVPLRDTWAGIQRQGGG